MTAFFGALVCAGGCAANVALYAEDPNPWSAGAGVFCGLLVFIQLTILLRDGVRR